MGDSLSHLDNLLRFIIMFSTSVHIRIRCITVLAVIRLFPYAVLTVPDAGLD